MRRVAQLYKDGHLKVVEVPTPRAHSAIYLSVWSFPGQHISRDMCSNWPEVAAEQSPSPSASDQVIVQAQSEGTLRGWRQVLGRPDAAMPLGYSSVGVAVDVVASLNDFVVGDRREPRTRQQISLRGSSIHRSWGPPRQGFGSAGWTT